MALHAGGRREQIARLGIGFALLSSALLALQVRLPEGAGFGLSLALHGPHLLLALAAGAGLGVAGAFHAAEDDAGAGHPLLFAAAAGAALGGSRGSELLGLSPVPGFLLGATACGIVFVALAWGASRLRGAACLVTGVLLVLFLAAALAGALEAKGDPGGLRPWIWWILGDVSRASWSSAVPTALTIAILSGVLLRGVTPGAELSALPEAQRARLLGLSGLLFGLCLGAVGLVAFLAVIVAVSARRLIAAAPLRSWAGVSALLGALAMLWADALPRALFGGLAPPLGMGVAAVAIPWFLLRGDGRSWRLVRALEVVLGLLLVVGIVGAGLLLRQLARFVA